jgi:CubicO group peptidase (beta-lactamase class C family)
LSDKVFGPGGILNADPYFANANVTDTRVYNITIQNLLEHSAGWNSSLPMPPGPVSPYPFPIGHSDPISFPLHVTQTLGEANPVTERALIKFLIQKGLNFTPGTASNYSNVGYLVLGEVIERKTGLSYENYVKQNIFAPLGIYDIRLGKNRLEDKQEREGEYITTPTPFMPSAYGTGEVVPAQYGGLSIEAMDAHGGWIATARDLVRLLTAVDGFPSRPDILSASTIQIMTTPSATFAGYAKGWSVNSSTGFWSHTGGLPGTASFIARTSDQYTWAIILNKNTTASGFLNAMTALGRNCINSITTFPTHDLFDLPTQNASAMNFSNVTSNSISVNWTNGNGDGRVLIMRAGNAPNKFPLDGTEYTGSPEVDLGDGNRVVYSGTGNSATVSNLNANTNYQFRLYEYKKNANTGNYALYQLANPASGSQNTLGTTAQRTRFDFDGDGKADVSVFRNGNWYIQGSISGFSGRNWGFATDIPAPADFDGDGRTDVSVFRDGNWYWINSSNDQFNAIQFGQNGDIPVPADFDGDGKDDISVFRPTNGTWYRLNSSQNNQFFAAQFGINGDKPLIGDFDGDGKSDLAVTRSTNGTLAWYWVNSSTNQFEGLQFGFSTDIATPADYDGDGKTDVSVFRPSNGTWYRLNSAQNRQFTGVQFGSNGDLPVPADYDGDGKADIAVFRAGIWYRLNSSNNSFYGEQFGVITDKPIPNAFVR